MSETNTIGKDYNLKQLAKFCVGPVISRLFVALLHTLDDGLFISRYCGKYALAAFSIAMPLFMLIDAFGMLFIGAGTRSSILMGEKKNKEANDCFTTICLLAFVSGMCISIVIGLFSNNLLKLLGATEILLPYASAYINIGKFYVPLLVINYVFERFYTIAGKPKINVITTTVNTILNFLFDYIFIVRMQVGIVGAAYANMLAYVFSFVFGIIFFSNKNHEVHFTNIVEKPIKLVGDVFKLGRSSFLTSLAISINSYVANLVLLACASEDGVAAYTIVNNIQFMFMNGFFGLVATIGPLVSYAYGEKNKDKLVKLLKNTYKLSIGLSICIMLLYLCTKNYLVQLYLTDGQDDVLLNMVRYGMMISPYALFVFSFNVTTQELANSLSNYKIATRLSMLENIVFNNLFMILLPNIFGIDGVWYVFLIAEGVTLFFSGYVIYKHADAYGYGKNGVATLLENK